MDKTFIYTSFSNFMSLLITRLIEKLRSGSSLSLFIYLYNFYEMTKYHTVYCKFGNFHEGFIFAKLHRCEVSWKLNTREMAKSLCR